MAQTLPGAASLANERWVMPAFDKPVEPSRMAKPFSGTPLTMVNVPPT